MYAFTSFTSYLDHEFLGNTHSRKLVVQYPLINRHNSTTLLYLGSHNANVVAILLTVLLCAFIGSLVFCCCCIGRRHNLDIHGFSSTTNHSPILENRGITKKTLKTFPIVTYSEEIMNLPSLDTECVICLSEFTNDEKVRILPKCNHCFHVPCIDKWLSSHSSCPKCRQYLVLAPVPETIISIEQLQPEGFIRNYREV